MGIGVRMISKDRMRASHLLKYYVPVHQEPKKVANGLRRAKKSCADFSYSLSAIGVECTQGIQNSVPISQLFRQYYGDLNPLRLEPRAATIFVKSISVDRTHMSRGYSEITATVNVLFCNTNIQYIIKACCGQNALHAFYALLSVD